jgi:hypothetical protein
VALMPAASAVLALAVAAGFLLAPAKARADIPVDLELVLAVDVSMSMDPDEIALQRKGYIEAFRSPEVVRAILETGEGRVAVTYMEWAGHRFSRFAVPWQLIDSVESAARFVEMLEADEPSRVDRTSISAALTTAAASFEGNGYRGKRKVIDVSGDGPNNDGETLPAMRDELVAEGIVINGLAIMAKPAPYGLGIDDLDEYYRQCVTGGNASFVLAIRDWGQFSRAIRYKLLQEITGAEPPARLWRVRQEEYDCRIGEKIWADFQRKIGIQVPE